MFAGIGCAEDSAGEKIFWPRARQTERRAAHIGAGRRPAAGGCILRFSFATTLLMLAAVLSFVDALASFDHRFESRLNGGAALTVHVE
jgi:hypothetical protein